MSNKPSSGSSNKKNQSAPISLIHAVEKLFDIASTASTPSQLQAMSRDKLFEMLVMTRVLRAFRRAHPKGTITHVPPKNGSTHNIVVACKPALADRKRFSHFDLFDDAGHPAGEVWTSVEFESLSWHVGGGLPGLAPRKARHELDVCVLAPGTGARPSHDDILAGISCKDVLTATKENVREALGLRRETAFFNGPFPNPVPWLTPTVPDVPANPPSPILLASSDLKVRSYASPVDAMGVYVRFVRRPWASENEIVQSP